jgi:hypothetical protein
MNEGGEYPCLADPVHRQADRSGGNAYRFGRGPPQM